MSLKKQALSGIFWTGLQQISSQIIIFIISVILARILMPEEFGLIGMIAIFIAIGNALINGGMASSLIRSGELDEDDYTTVFYFNLIASVLIYLLVYLAAPYIAGFYNQPVLTKIIRVYSLVFIIQSFSIIQETRLTKLMDFKTQMQINIPSLVIGGITGIIMALNHYGVWSLVGYKLVQATVKVLYYWYKTRWYPHGKFIREKFKKHFTFGYKLTLSGLLNTVFNNLYLIIIGHYFSAAQVGYYQRAKSLQSLPSQNLSTIITKVTYPLFSQIKNNNQRLKEAFARMMKMILFIIAPLMILLGVLAEPLFRFLFTAKWLPAVPYFQILVIVGILYPLHSYNMNILKVKGRSDLFLKLEIIKKILIVAVIAMVIPYGIYGLLYGSVVISLISYFINTYYAGNLIHYKVPEQIKDVIPIILLSLLAGIITFIWDYFLKNYLHYDFIRLLTGGLIFLAVYLVPAYYLKFESLYEIIHLLKQKLKS